jgi:dTDP-6-deoxy-L-talose 4-dehydrogenase (NAD+)
VAWYVEPEKYLTAPENLDCLIGTINFAKAAAAAGVRRFVGIGTCFEYDLSCERLDVEAPLNPLTPYAAAKTASFLSLSRTLPLVGVDFLWCRLFFLYGEGEGPNRLVPYLHKQLSASQPADLSHGAQIRDYLDVKDASNMIVGLAQGSTTGAVNICSGVECTVRQLAEKIADSYGRRDLLNFGARATNLVDPARIVGVR